MSIKNLLAAVVTAGVTISASGNAAPVEDPIYAAQSSTIIGVNHVGLSVVDLERSSNFYKQSMGLTAYGSASDIDTSLRNAGMVEQTGVRTVTLNGPNSFLRLMEFDRPTSWRQGEAMPVQGPGITHICFQAPKSRPLDGKAAENGATWVSSSNAMVDMRGVGFMYGYMRDPNGVMFEIEHAPEPKFEVDVWMGHVAFATSDLTRTVEFYEQLLGIKHYRRVDNIAGPTFDLVGGLKDGKLHGAWFRVAPFYNLEFWQYVNPRTDEPGEPAPMDQIGYNVVALETSDIEADFARLTAAGIALETGIVSVEGGRGVFLRDLDGNLLSLTEYEAGSSLSLMSLSAK